MHSFLDDLAAGSIQGRGPSRSDSLRILGGHDHLLDVAAAAARVRRHHFGNRVKLNTIINMKSGACAEDCSHCSQRCGSGSESLKYSWVDPERAAKLAD